MAHRPRQGIQDQAVSSGSDELRSTWVQVQPSPADPVKTAGPTEFAAVLSRDFFDALQ